jgi:sugar lactone lactonase YvrE
VNAAGGSAVLNPLYSGHSERRRLGQLTGRNFERTARDGVPFGLRRGSDREEMGHSFPEARGLPRVRLLVQVRSSSSPMIVRSDRLVKPCVSQSGGGISRPRVHRLLHLAMAVALLSQARLLAQIRYEVPYAFTRYAGIPTVTSFDGPLREATVATPHGIGVDRSGNIYIADSAVHLVRKIDRNGIVTTIAGGFEVSGAADGPGSLARFSIPRGVAVDATGTLFVSDSGNHTIRRIDRSGTVTTIAGKPGVSGNADGAGDVARFYYPWGLTFDIEGNLYVADEGNACVRKVTPRGDVSTVSLSLAIPDPSDVAVDDAGNLYVSDVREHKVVKRTPDGQVVVIATSADLRYPMGVEVDHAGNAYVSDSNNNRVVRISTAGELRLVAGGSAPDAGYRDGSGAAARFNIPSAIALDATGAILVCEVRNHSIRRITNGVVDTLIAPAASSQGHTDGPRLSARFDRPRATARDAAGNLYVAETFGGVRKIDLAGNVTTVAGSDYFAEPTGVAVAPSGTIYVTDWGNGFAVVRRLTSDGRSERVVGGADDTAGRDGDAETARFSAATGIVAAPDGTLYVSDSTTIRKVSVDGVVSTLAGVHRYYGFADGPSSSARFRSPHGLALDPAGNLYVVDRGNYAIRKVTPDGVVTTLAGVPGSYSTVRTGPPVDGTGAAAYFLDPTTVALGPDGCLYVTDGPMVRRVSMTGVVTTVADGRIGPDSAVPEQTHFRFATGITFDADGGFYVVDHSDNTVYKGARLPLPRITDGPANVLAGLGNSAVFTVAASGSELLYQWRKDGVVLAGNSSARSATLILTGLQFGDAGRYDCVVSNRAGSVSSSTAELTVTERAPSRLLNISVRARCGTGNTVTIGGFVVNGTAPRQVLIRAVGPSLSAQGLATDEVLADPQVEVHHGGQIVAQNDNWIAGADASAISDTAARVGAQPLAATDTRSSGLLVTLDPGVYTFVVKGVNDTSGIVLLEVYDAAAQAAGSQFVNIAGRAHAAGGVNVAIGGFVIQGGSPKRILLRATGPSLMRQGLAASEVLADPIIELHHGSATLNTNDDWVGNPDAADIRQTAARVGAAPFDAADVTSSALLLTLDPGVYTFIAQGKPGSTGIVLVEVYDAD